MIGVLCMAYGSPRSPDEIEPYLRDIRGGREPSPELLADLRARYERIGGVSPLNDITARQTRALRGALGDGFTAAIGMKHWTPSIPEGVAALRDGGAERVIGLALAPHYSSISIGGYESRVRAGMEAIGWDAPFVQIPSWYDDGSFVAFAAGRLRAALGDWGDARVFFTAHSLPARILVEGDPYRDQLLASADLIARAAGAADWEFAFQSASQTGEPWLGPDVLDRMRAFGAAGGRRAVVAPIGFVADHLEILFDVDVECHDVAAEAGIALRRTESPNDDPAFIEALASVVRRAARGAEVPA